MEDAMKGSTIKSSSMITNTLDDVYDDELSDLDLFVGFRTGSMDASSSGAAGNSGNPKKHKPSWQRKSKGSKELPLKNKVSVVDSKEKFAKVFKRKAQSTTQESTKCFKRDNNSVVPQEPSQKKAWCMIGDFNDILSNKEKLGGPKRMISSFQAFQEMLDICDMQELESSGNSFTWGGTRNDQWIQCKLDRTFGNSRWFAMFPNAHQWFLDKLGSDHRPVLVKFVNDQETFRESIFSFKLNGVQKCYMCLEAILGS
ncbi:unnamed protein product [Arabidopsis arenosa]|uniref:Uncharacterized protein n=1 Tax=Arabidopsis arenosa TaxID=38785 RepID=A0A8S1ZWM2_ARAAE|nr:unnamed protein product [Arabidopsis arenosa]